MLRNAKSAFRNPKLGLSHAANSDKFVKLLIYNDLLHVCYNFFSKSGKNRGTKPLKIIVFILGQAWDRGGTLGTRGVSSVIISVVITTFFKGDH